MRSPWSRIAGALTIAVLVSGCSGESTSQPSAEPGRADSDGSSSPVPATPAEAAVVCPNAMGGQCLGDLEGGTRYRTETFTPQISYTTPAGWSNLEDLSGNFLLLPPGRSLEGVDAGTADYLGIYSGASVSAADCAPEPVPGVGLAPDAVVAELAERPGLDVSTPRRVVVGGLEGMAISIDLEPGTTAGCRVEGGLTIVPLFIGVGPASVEHAQFAGLRTHLYVLDNGRSNVVVEVSDVGADTRPFDYEQVVENLTFSPGG
jgi:hypothetical protein